MSEYERKDTGQLDRDDAEKKADRAWDDTKEKADDAKHGLKEAGDKASDAVEELIPGDSDHDGH